ncbi:MAG: PRC-barrel domain-containing protein [Phycisphaerae bacterium]|nr:PRC-barrel domain-containing protein [Phycisphaerae bacterium]
MYTKLFPRGLSLVLTGLAVLAIALNLAAATDATEEIQSTWSQKDQAAETQTAMTTRGTVQLQRASHCIGAKVVDSQQQDLGTIHDIVLTPARDKVSYVVLAYGGFLGMGDKYFAVPYESFRAQADKLDTMILPIEKQKFESMEGFDRQNWPDKAESVWLVKNPSWERQANEMKEQGKEMAKDVMKEKSPVAAEAEKQLTSQQQFEYRKVSKLIGLDIQNPQGQELANINDLTISSRGHLIFAIISYGGAMGIGEKLAAVPFSEILIQPDRQFSMLDADATLLDSVSFAEDQFQKLNDRTFAQNILSKFNQQISEEPYWQVYGYVGEEAAGIEYFDTRSIKSFSGEIQNVSTMTIDEQTFVSLRFQSDDGKTFNICPGPQSYISQQNLNFRQGDNIKVTGSLVTIDNQQTLLATEIEKDGKTHLFRSRRGQPMW